MAAWSVTEAIADRIRHYRERPQPFSYETIALIVGVGKRSVQRCVARGYTSSIEAYRASQAKAPPANYRDLVDQHTGPQLVALLGVSQRTLTNWNRRLGIKIDCSKPHRGKPAHNRKEMPEGFRAYYEANGHKFTKAHFGLSSCLMGRFVRETGGPLNPRKRKAPVTTAPMPAIAQPVGYDQFKRKLPPPRFIYGQAA